MSENVVDYDDVKRMMEFLGVKYIEVDFSPKAVIVLKGEENFQMFTSYRE